jgi:hypothetical protein
MAAKMEPQRPVPSLNPPPRSPYHAFVGLSGKLNVNKVVNEGRGTGGNALDPDYLSDAGRSPAPFKVHC